MSGAPMNRRLSHKGEMIQPEGRAATGSFKANVGLFRCLTFAG